MNALTLAFGAHSTTPLSRYNIDVEEFGEPTGSSQSRGRFKARCRETGTELVSVNAEYNICYALTIAYWPDGPVQFWRGSARGLSHSSIHRMGRYRIALGEQYPQRVKRKDARPEISSESVEGSPQNRESEFPRPSDRDDARRARRALPREGKDITRHTSVREAEEQARVQISLAIDGMGEAP